MKKGILILLVVAILLVTAGCSLRRCEFCRDFGAERREIDYGYYTSTYYLCDDCYYDYYYDDYDYYDYDYDYYSYSCK